MLPSHPCSLKDLACQADGLFDMPVHRVPEILLVEHRDMHGNVRPHLPVMGVTDGVRILYGRLAHMQGITGIGKCLSDLPHILQHLSEIAIIGRRLPVRLRKRSVKIDLISYLEELAFFVV